MILRIFGHDFHYECENLCRVYYPNEKIEIKYDGSGDDPLTVETRLFPEDGGARVEVITSINGSVRSAGDEVKAPEDELRDKCELRIAQLMFELLSAETGYTPPWGVLTGVRPQSSCCAWTAQFGEQGAADYFTKGCSSAPRRLALPPRWRRRRSR